MSARRINTGSGFIWVFLAVVWLFAGCTNYTIPDEDKKKISAASCEGCHTDYERLIEVHTPDTAAPVGGCGGEALHYEPYDRVFLGGTGYKAFKSSVHYGIGCTGCHNGNGETGDKTLAHSGDWISHPSTAYQEKCGSCHQEITDLFPSSLHNGTGQKRKVAMRSGLSGADDFDQLPGNMVQGYNNNCAQCHGTCGNCHLVRPPIAGGGLAKGHDFTKTPDMLNVCVSCHVSRGGHAYLGVAAGTEPDAHLDNMGFDCLSCHDGHEMHGDGNPVERRYAYAELPECETCHPNLATSNDYHSYHYNDFNCHVCHSQDYNNCGSCHVNGAGARIPAYMDFKIAGNPIPDLKTGYDLVLVRRTLAAPDNWKEYGVETYADFDVLPTYNYTTPHNLLKWTDRTEVSEGEACSSNCHIRKEGDSLINKELYLFQADLLEWEISATGPITVDDKLPTSWTE